MERFSIILVLFLLQEHPLTAQLALPMLLPSDVPDATLTTRGTFEGKALYGYIDGGAELYLEYGFRSLIVQSVASNDESYQVEVYGMSDSAAAVGIHSVSRFDCTYDQELGPFSCVSQHQMQFAQGPFFVRIANTSGSAQAILYGQHLGQRLMMRIPGKPFILPPLFTDSLLGNNNYRSLLLCRGGLGLQNGIDEWTNLFEGIKQFELEVLPIERDTTAIRIAILEFQSESDRRTFLRRWRNSSNPRLHRFAAVRGRHTAILLESTASEEGLRPYRRLLERY